ncbi:hypothetical protein THAOC_02054, partial [Thalassiosira oceanica]
MISSPSSNRTLARLLQPSNAKSPNSVTLEGMVDAALERPSAQPGDARRYGHLPQRQAARECIVSDGQQISPLVEVHFGQVPAALECSPGNMFDLRADADARDFTPLLLRDLPTFVEEDIIQHGTLAFAPSRPHVLVHDVRLLPRPDVPLPLISQLVVRLLLSKPTHDTPRGRGKEPRCLRGLFLLLISNHTRDPPLCGAVQLEKARYPEHKSLSKTDSMCPRPEFHALYESATAVSRNLTDFTFSSSDHRGRESTLSQGPAVDDEDRGLYRPIILPPSTAGRRLLSWKVSEQHLAPKLGLSMVYKDHARSPKPSAYRAEPLEFSPSGRNSMGSNLVAVRTASRAVRTAAGPQLDRNRTAGLAVRTAKL